MDKEQLQALYLREEYYWGKEPNQLAKKLLEFVPEEARAGKLLADLGAGEGRDSVFLAQQGFEVLAIDLAPAGLDKTVKLADEKNVFIQTLAADLNDLVLPEPVDLIYSIGTLQYIHPSHRQRQFEHLKNRTLPGGLHVLFAFVEHPEVAVAPDWGHNEYLYGRDELQNSYLDWDILDTYEYVFACNSSNIPHRHAARVLIARKPA
jgi:tellurite methyltransferase